MTPNPSSLRLVCFDLGRVLVRICDDWPHACRVAGVAMPAALPASPEAARLYELIIAMDAGRISFDQFVANAAPLMRMTPAQVQSASDAYLLRAYEGVDEVIGRLHSRGIATACLSNTNESHWQFMNDPSHPAYLPLDKLTHRFASFQVGHRKPDEGIYVHVEQATGLRGAEILFFDDVQEYIDAATRRGWRGHRIDPKPDDPLAQIKVRLGEHL
jgi:HAD superfamily hydrolase (TIGR01509 family)